MPGDRRSRFKVGGLAIAAALTLVSACGDEALAPIEALAASTTTSIAPADTTSTTIVVASEMTAPASTTAEESAAPGPPDLVIRGTGKVYSAEEAQAFGEFGPLLWNLVTTLNRSDSIEHGPRHEWVVWGPLWGGPIPYESSVYGVTDLDAVDLDAIAAAVPVGTSIRLRQVAWSLDDLNRFKADLVVLVMRRTVCHVGPSSPVDGITIVSVTDEIDLGGVPPEAVLFEIVDSCPEEGTLFPGPTVPSDGSSPAP